MLPWRIEVYTYSFSLPLHPQDNAELFAEEVEKEVAAAKEVERARLAAVPGLLPQAAQALPADDMADA
jgi:hypothetical protein